MASAPKTPSLYARMQMHGTLTETPRDVPDARFALQSTIHWMRALATRPLPRRKPGAVARSTCRGPPTGSVGTSKRE
jgi:hypothetical protein